MPLDSDTGFGRSWEAGSVRWTSPNDARASKRIAAECPRRERRRVRECRWIQIRVLGARGKPVRSDGPVQTMPGLVSVLRPSVPGVNGAGYANAAGFRYGFWALVGSRFGPMDQSKRCPG